MSKLSIILKLPLQLLILGSFIGSFVGAYLELVNWVVPFIYSMIVILFLFGKKLGNKKEKEGGEEWEDQEIVKG